MSPADRVALLRTREVQVQVVGYSPAELAERAVAEALAAARALGRLWRRRASRARRVEALAAMGVELETPRSIVDALIKTTLTGGFRLVPCEPPPTVWRELEPGWCTALNEPEDHEPFLLTRPPTRLGPGGA